MAKSQGSSASRETQCGSVARCFVCVIICFQITLFADKVAYNSPVVLLSTMAVCHICALWVFSDFVCGKKVAVYETGNELRCT